PRRPDRHRACRGGGRGWEAPMTSTLPSRWQEILRREAAQNVTNVLAQARDHPEPARVPRWLVPGIVVVVASLFLLSMIRGGEARGAGSLPFDRSTMISTRTAGLGASAADLAPQRPDPSTAAAAAPLPVPDKVPTSEPTVR